MSASTWADMPGGDDGHEEQSYETEADENGIRTVVEFTTKRGRRVKVTRRMQRAVVNKEVNDRVEARKRWARFGECAGKGPGAEPGITMQGDPVQIESSAQKKEEQHSASETTSQLGTRCRTCGAVGDHWTAQCPLRGQLAPASLDVERRDARPSRSTGSEETRSRINEKRDESTLRVTNLSDETTEDDLRDLFRPFGPLSRVYLVKDRLTQQSRGFAFVTFYERKDAAQALARLSGHGYDHLILHLEWSNSSSKDSS